MSIEIITIFAIHMTRLFKTKDGYEVVKHSRDVYAIIGKRVKYIGKVSSSYQSSGRLLKNIPNEIKSIFFKLQQHELESPTTME
jgi:hypothetical protein